MDEMWQRHKTFILQVIVGGVLFLVAFFVMRSMYGDQNDPQVVQVRNANRKQELEAKTGKGQAPSARSISEQKTIAESAEKMKRELAARVASTAGADDKLKELDRRKAYVKENVNWALRNIQKSDDGYLNLYDQVPQACLSRLRDASRSVLIGKAAQAGKEIDESLGLSSGFPDDEIPEALHGLAIVTDVYSRCLTKSGIEKITNVRVVARSSFPEMNEVSFVTAIGVHFEITGDPADIADLVRSFNSVGKADRMTVLDSIEFIVPISPDEDTVKASINVAGLKYESHQQAEGN